jgi:cell wall-associated NlpC family hydrolase
MSLVVVKTACAPLRRDASDASEMVSELLLGESAEVLESTGRWHRVRCTHDGYEGWISVAQVHQASERQEKEWLRLQDEPRYGSETFILMNSRGDRLPVLIGSVLPAETGGVFKFPFGSYRRQNPASSENKASAGVREAAMLYLGAPYLWGGRSCYGVDCSGFIQVVFRFAGICLPRDASQQIGYKECHSTRIENARELDLVYFRFDNGNVSHVGIYLGDGLLIHASGDVHIDQLDAGKRNSSEYAFNERLAAHICGIQTLIEPPLPE